ncbi:MAG: adenylate kinase [Treponemataceae bacterium]|nr:adenylate kinase [Treponemataceae bacterium]
MIVLIAGATHTGKTVLAQKLLERYAFPYLSIDHLKMGLIRSGQTTIKADGDGRLTPYLWSIVAEIIKTAIENGQNLIVEGCYIPFDWQKDFGKAYLPDITYYCLIMSRDYILNHFSDIVAYEHAVEHRLVHGDFTRDGLIKDNERSMRLCKQYALPYILIDKAYDVDINL